MESRPIDYSKSIAILLGVDKFDDPDFPSVPAALNSLEGMSRILASPDLCGWPEDRVRVVRNPTNAGRVARELREQARKVRDVLFIYYVGHGKLTMRGQLCLAVQDTLADSPDFTGIPYDWVATALRDSPARVKITVLDCCFSGQAIEALADSDVADLAHVAGVYTLTATTRNQTAHVVPLDQQESALTSFTGQFVELLEHGVTDGPPRLSLSDIYRNLQQRLAQLGLPRPNQRGTDTIAQFLFAKNVAVVDASAKPIDLTLAPTTRTNRRMVLFAGVECHNAADLALALLRDWDQAQERVIQRVDGGALHQQVSLLVGDEALSGALELLKDTSGPAARLANLLVEMNPALPPVYRGKDLRPAAIALRLTDPNAMAEEVRLMEDAEYGILRTGILQCWAALQGMDPSGEVERRLMRAWDILRSHKSTLDHLGARDGTKVDQVKAAVYVAAINPPSVESIRQMLADRDTRAASEQAWWKKLADLPSDYAPALALATEPFARAETEKARAAKRRPRTRREVAAGWTRVNLPPELAEQFPVATTLRSGAEGTLLRVEDRAGEPFVVKLYIPGLDFDDNAMSLLARADPAHVVRLLQLGRALDGSRYEVLEWCEHGSLRDLLDSGHNLDLATVVSQLTEALAHIHSLRLDDAGVQLVHLDLKPENVLVRTLAPLDLILGDFGLARMIAVSRHYTNRQQGSRPWAPPSGEAITPRWDWWSLGMIVAELAGGHHPFCVSGAWLSDAAISDHLSQNRVDLSDIKDLRVRTLCDGLLARRGDDRWGAEEVREWLAGDPKRTMACPYCHRRHPSGTKRCPLTGSLLPRSPTAQ